MSSILEEFSNMEMAKQLFISAIAAITVCIPLYYYKAKQYRKAGRSVKYLELKLVLLLSPLILAPLLISKELPVIVKIIIFIASITAVILYYLSLIATHNRRRKLLGLPPRDEHTGLVIRDKGKRRKR